MIHNKNNYLYFNEFLTKIKLIDIIVLIYILKQKMERLRREINVDWNQSLSYEEIMNFFNISDQESFDIIREKIEDKISDDRQKVEMLMLLQDIGSVESEKQLMLENIIEIIKWLVNDAYEEVFNEYTQIDYLWWDLEQYSRRKHTEEDEAVVSYLIQTEWISVGVAEEIAWANINSHSAIMVIARYWIQISKEIEELRQSFEEWREKAIMASDIKEFSSENFHKACSEIWRKYDYDANGLLWYYEMDELNAMVSEYINNENFQAKIVELDSIFSNWVELKDLLNTRTLLETVWVNKVEYVLCDYDNNWKYDEEDKWSMYWRQLLDAFLDAQRQFKIEWKPDSMLYENISSVFKSVGIDVDLKSKQDLYNLLMENPNAKYEFVRQIWYYTTLWVDAWFIFRYWVEAYRRSFESLEKIVYDDVYWKVWEVILNESISAFTDKIDEWIDDIEKWKITDPRIINVINSLNNRLYRESLIEAISDQIRKQWVIYFLTFLSSASDFSYISFMSEHEELSAIQAKQKEFIDSLSIETTYTLSDISDWAITIWLVYSWEATTESDMTYSWSVWFSVWYSDQGNIVYSPSIWLWATDNYNREDIENSTLRWFSEPSRSFWITAELLWFATWLQPSLRLSYNSERFESIKLKYAQYQWFIDYIFDIYVTWDITLDWVIEWFREKLKGVNDIDLEELEDENIVEVIESLKNENIVNEIEQMLEKIRWLLEQVDFDNLTDNQKIYILDWIKSTYILKWLENLVLFEEKKWYELSSVSIWVVYLWILSAISPIWWLAWLLWWMNFVPVLWFSQEKITVSYRPDMERKFLHSLSFLTGTDMEDVSMWNTLKEFTNNLEQYLNISWLSISVYNWNQIKITPPAWSKLTDILNLFCEPSVLKEVKYLPDWSIILWNIWDIWYSHQLLKDWEVHNLIIWWWKIDWKIVLTEDSLQSFEWNNPWPTMEYVSTWWHEWEWLIESKLSIANWELIQIFAKNEKLFEIIRENHEGDVIRINNLIETWNIEMAAKELWNLLSKPGFRNSPWIVWLTSIINSSIVKYQSWDFETKREAFYKLFVIFSELNQKVIFDWRYWDYQKRLAFEDVLRNIGDMSVDEIMDSWDRLNNDSQRSYNFQRDSWVIWFWIDEKIWTSMYNFWTVDVLWNHRELIESEENKLFIARRIVQSWFWEKITQMVVNLFNEAMWKLEEWAVSIVQLRSDQIEELLTKWQLTVMWKSIFLDRDFIMFYEWIWRIWSLWIDIKSISIDDKSFDLWFSSDWKVLTNQINIEKDERWFLGW